MRELPEAFKAHILKPGECPPGAGRKHGSKGRSTIEREKAYLEKLEISNLPYKLLDKLEERLDDDNIKTSEVIKAIQVVNTFYIRTVDQAETTEVAQAITTAEQAKERISDFKNTLTQLRAVK